MSTDVVEGVEYFNTVVVQPHRKLVTNQGRGYHVRCRYQTQEKLLQNDFNVRWAAETCMVANLDNRKNVDPQIIKWNARKKLHYTEEVILPDPFFLLPIILNFLTSSWLNFSVEHENCASICLSFVFSALLIPSLFIAIPPLIDVVVFRFKWAESAQNRLGIRYLEACPTRSPQLIILETYQTKNTLHVTQYLIFSTQVE